MIAPAAEARFGLTPSQARLLAMLIAANGEVAPVETLQAARPDKRRPDPTGATLRRLVFDTRNALHAAGVHGVICTAYTRGYRVPPSAAERVLKALRS
jgi:DNA-binding winged helix-turn-helix (wHTH) protein